LNRHFAELPVLRLADVVFPFLRQEDVDKEFCLYRISSFFEMPAGDCGPEHHVMRGVHDVTSIQVVIDGLTFAKRCQEIGVIGGELRDLRIQVSRW
jgi:hypothetical protein